MDKLSLMEQLCFSTTRIETYDANGNGYSGTGFFFRLEIDGNKKVPLVVTNKHVVRGMAKGFFILTKADSNGNPMHKDHVKIEIEKFEQNWIFHPDDNVDLCVLPVANIFYNAQIHGVPLFYRTFEDTHIPSGNRLNDLDAVEEILMIGYPNGLWDSVNNMPIVRKGITATDIKFDYEDRKEFMIDAACFPGSSGSPVLICNTGSYQDKQGRIRVCGSRVLLLGILYAGPQLTVTGEIKVVNIPNMQQKQLAVSHIPNNLGYVIKSERIKDFAPILKKRLNL